MVMMPAAEQQHRQKAWPAEHQECEQQVEHELLSDPSRGALTPLAQSVYVILLPERSKVKVIPICPGPG
jgi:hypothetical protein